MAHGDGRDGMWRGNWRMEWVASTLHISSEHVVSSITTADAHTSAASSRLNWRPRRFKWTHPFRRKTKSGFSTCAITFQTHSTRGIVVLFFVRIGAVLLLQNFSFRRFVCFCWTLCCFYGMIISVVDSRHLVVLIMWNQVL